MSKSYCKCKACRKAWKKDKVLGSYLQRFFGLDAWKVSSYVKRPERRKPDKNFRIDVDTE